MSHIRHPHILQFYGGAIDDDHFHIIFERYERTLETTINHHSQTLNLEEEYLICYHILGALEYLHLTFNAIHGNISSSNIVWIDCKYKLGSIGKIKILQDGRSNYAGSPIYAAPEVHFIS